MPRSKLASRIHIGVFLIAIVLWTVALLLPVPHQAANEALGGPMWVYLVGKSLHVGAYLFLAVLGGTAFLNHARWRWIIPGLFVHGAVAEFFQQFVGRTASARDVLLDGLGAILGYGIVLWWARIKSRRLDLAGGSSPESDRLVESSRPDHLPNAASTEPTTVDSR